MVEIIAIRKITPTTKEALETLKFLAKGVMEYTSKEKRISRTKITAALSSMISEIDRQLEQAEQWREPDAKQPREKLE